MPQSIIKTSDITKFWTAVINLGVILVALYATSFYSYVLFHTLAEIVSVVLAIAIFLVAWNARRYWGNNYYILIGLGFLFVGIIDLIHAFEYKGVGIIRSGGDSNVATQLWLAGRYLIACSFLVAPFLSHRKLKTGVLFATFAAITAFLFLAIFYWKFFPAAYVEGNGITTFKKASEYALIAIFLAGFVYFYRMRREFHDRVFRLLSLVLLIMALTEFLFTLYVGVYDFFNLIGHLLKIVAYYLAYLGIVEFGLMKPYQTLFKDLKDKSLSLRQATNEWNLMFNSITDPTFIIDNNHIVKAVNKAMCDFMETSREDLVGRKCFEFMHKKHKPWNTCPMKITCKHKRPHTEEIYEPTLGKTLLVTTSPILDEKGEVIGILHISKDITEIKQAQESIRSMALFPEENPYPVMRVARDGTLLYANSSAGEFLKQWGCKVGELIPVFVYGIFAAVLDSGVRREIEFTCDKRILSFVLMPIAERDYVNLYGRDITERKAAEEQAEYLSTHDALTGLCNRHFFENELQKFSGRRHFKGGVLMIDINDLKKTNDTLGHAAGDKLIQNAAKLLAAEFRETDVVARIGGDEFCVLLPDRDLAEIEAMAGRLQKRVREAYQDEVELMRLTISVGAAWVGSGEELNEALISADEKMYSDKLAWKKLANR